jgi:hypothetical protein
MRWLLLSFTVLFAALAGDAWRLSRPKRRLPLSLEEPHLTNALSHLAISSQLERQRMTRYRVGNLSASVYLFAMLALAAGVATIVAFTL